MILIDDEEEKNEGYDVRCVNMLMRSSWSNHKEGNQNLLLAPPVCQCGYRFGCDDVFCNGGQEENWFFTMTIDDLRSTTKQTLVYYM
jgi:hypothetical protein